MDGTTRLWEADSGEELIRWEGYQDWVTRVAFSPDGRLVISGDQIGKVYCWECYGPQPGRLAGTFLAAYEIIAIHWLDDHYLLPADTGGPHHKPNIYQLILEGL